MKKLLLFLTSLIATAASGALLDVKVPQQVLASPPTWTDRVVPFESVISTTLTSYRSGMGLGTEDSPTFTGLTLSGLTDTRVVLAGTAGLLGGDADLTFSGTRLTATDLTVTGFPTFTAGTATRVPFFTTAGLVTDAATLTFTSGTGTLAATTFLGALSGNATTATTLQTPRAIYGNNFDGSAALTQVIASTYGGTGNGFTKFTGPTTAEKTFALPDASSTLLYAGGPLGTPASGTLTNTTGFPAASLAGTALPAAIVTSSLTTVGALNSGSITSGFGSIDVGTDNISGGAISGTTGTFTGTVQGSKEFLSIGAASVTTAASVRLEYAGASIGRVVSVGADAATYGQFAVLVQKSDGTNYSSGLFTSTGLNNTAIGATTATTGRFTNLNVTDGDNWLLINGTAVAGGNANSLYAKAGVDWNVQIGGSTKLSLSSTGLAVTGGITGSSSILSTAATAYFAGDSATPGNLYYGSTAADSPVHILVNNSTKGTFSSTGLAVTGTATATGVILGGGETAGSSNAILASVFASSTTGLSLRSSDDVSGVSFTVYRRSNGTVIGSVGRVGTTDAVAYNTSSDARLKTNIRDFTAEDSGRIIDGLRPRWFDWKASDLTETVEEADNTPLVPVASGQGSLGSVTTDPANVDRGQGKSDIRYKKVQRKVTDPKRLADHAANNRSIIGFIAQEEAAVDPALVRSGAVTVGDDDPATITQQWQRSDAALVPVLVAELKALRARMAAAEAKIAALEARP